MALRRLRHFLRAVAQGHDARGRALDDRFRQDEQVDAVVVIELLGDVAGEFDVLLLVLTDRHVCRLVDQDVGRHQVWIDVQARTRGIAVLAGLVLELGHAVQPAEAGDAVEDPGEFRVRRHMALHEQGRARRIDARRDIAGRDFAGGAGQLRRFDAICGDGVEIHHAEEALIVLLHPDPIADRTEIVAEMEISGRLDAGQDAAAGHGESFWKGPSSSEAAR